MNHFLLVESSVTSFGICSGLLFEGLIGLMIKVGYILKKINMIIMYFDRVDVFYKHCLRTIKNVLICISI